MQDASAYIRGLAQLRGRNAEWAERAVREAVSLSANEARAQHVVDLIAQDPADLARQLDGHTVTTTAGTVRLATAHAPLVVVEPDWRSRFLAIIADPNVALILLTIGIYGLFFEFANPGFVLPGVAGTICLLVGLFAMQLLPISYAGLGLVLLGLGCLVAEAFLPTFGVLGFGGIVSFTIGALMLIDTEVPGYGIPWPVIASLALGGGLGRGGGAPPPGRDGRRGDGRQHRRSARRRAAGRPAAWRGRHCAVRRRLGTRARRALARGKQRAACRRLPRARHRPPRAAAHGRPALRRAGAGTTSRTTPGRTFMIGFTFGFSSILIVFVVVLVASSIRIFREYERGVVFMLGRFWKVKGPGLVLIIPIVQQVVRIDLRTVVFDVPAQDVITRDNVSVKVNAVVYFRVVDPEKAVIQVARFFEATSQLAQTTLRAVLGKHELDALLAEREQLNADIQKTLDAQTDAWGIKVSTVEIKHVDLNETMIRAIARQAEAERERRAKVIHAEGELQASEKLLQAAQRLALQPQAMQLRYLQTLTTIAADKNSTIVFPLPVDLLGALLERLGGKREG